ncbi:hypothetical protein GCM10027056_29840 [Glaciibacter psychrotolerans]
MGGGYDTGGGGSGEGEPGAGADGGGAAPGMDVNDPLYFTRDTFGSECPVGAPCDPGLVVRVGDLVNIPAGTPTSGMEPNGWAIVGLPANFYSRAEAHVRSGVLLGYLAEVRFTPLGFGWAYGDGSHGRTGTGGASWAAQGRAEFDETATSHVYGESGSFVVTPRALYTAEFRFNSGAWRTVAGTVSVAGPAFTVVVGQAKTLLVGSDCRGKPQAPGC